MPPGAASGTERRNVCCGDCGFYFLKKKTSSHRLKLACWVLCVVDFVGVVVSFVGVVAGIVAVAVAVVRCNSFIPEL